MDVFWYLLLVLLLLASVVLTALDYPGTWMMLLGVFGYFQLRHHAYFSWLTLFIICALTIGAELVDRAVGSGARAKRAGARWRGKIGGTIGGILGGIFLTFLIPVFILGTIAGIVAGCFLGAMLAELTGGRTTNQALAIGAGTAKGRLAGILVKIAFSLVILLFTLYVAFPHHSVSLLNPLITTKTQERNLATDEHR